MEIPCVWKPSQLTHPGATLSKRPRLQEAKLTQLSHLSLRDITSKCGSIDHQIQRNVGIPNFFRWDKPIYNKFDDISPYLFIGEQTTPKIHQPVTSQHV